MITIYLGRRGSGKTTTMIKDAYIEYVRGRRVISNMESVSFAEFMTNEQIKQISKNSDIENAVLLIDEMQIFFDSRRSMKGENINFSYFVQQIRKRNVDILGTTQFSNAVEKRVRDHTDFVCRPQFLKKYNLIKVTYYDETSTQDIDVDETVNKGVVYNPDKIFKLFDTNEKIGV